MWVQQCLSLRFLLDIAWIKDDCEEENDELPEPAVLAQKAMSKLEVAITELEGMLKELGEEISI
jgi:type I restriction enzyme M protein